MIYLLHHLLENAAQQYPDNPAFRFLDETLSYAELNEKTTKLARALLDQGVRRGDRVAIYLNKSMECAIAIYGIFKAGAAYVPLDPGAPLARVDRIIRQCDIRCMVSHDARQQDLTALIENFDTPLEFILGVSDVNSKPDSQLSWSQIFSLPAQIPHIAGMTQQDLAYIMYTSGSTGNPKGIMHSHASALSYARMAADLYSVTAGDRLSNHSPLHFDMSTFDYFCAPLTGACTVIIAEAYTKLPVSLAELIATERITIWYSVPFALIQLYEHGLLQQHDFSALRLVMFGGEPFLSKYLSALGKLWAHAQFCNVYGPAEVNQCSWYFIPAGWPENAPNCPIGQICSNAEALILDESDNPVTPGDAGELMIRSPTMMLGYWNRPDLNATAFYSRKMSDDISDKFYRTGDYVRREANVGIHFLGRKDRQIKLRGYRIELDEIESLLAMHPSVEEAAVYKVTDSEGLIAAIESAVTLKNGFTETIDSLSLFAAEVLPHYAVPESIIIVDHFPRTTSAKIDRHRLATEAARRRTNRV